MQMKCRAIIKEMIWMIVPVFAAYILLTRVLFVSVVQSGSMEPTLMTGYTVFYDRLATNDIKRGDVVAFYSYEFKKYMGKRVVGLPGDDITFEEGKIYINGVYYDESVYLDEKVKTYSVYKEFIVPEGRLFLLGDNRENSYDSRFWNNPYIRQDCVLGTYLFHIDLSLPTFR